MIAPTDQPERLLLSDRDVAELLSISRRSVWRLRAEGELPEPIKLAGRIVRWRRADIEEWVESQR